MKRTFLFLAFLALVFGSPTARADLFGSGEHTFEIKFVPIINPDGPAGQHVVGGRGGGTLVPGNRPDSNSPGNIGSVAYHYRIGKYEISEEMIDQANALGGLGITHDNRGPNKPVTSVSWFDAARFVNWLNISTGHTPAYKFDSNGDFQLWEPGDVGYNPDNLFRNSEAKYFLSSADEWHKAAYYDPTTPNGTWYHYPTENGAPPISVASGTDPGTAVFRQGLAVGPADITQAGGLSPYGTMGQGGNVWEWNETASNDPLSIRRLQGGFWDNLLSSLSSSSFGIGLPDVEFAGVGFRVASIIPEPSTLVLASIGLFGAFRLCCWNRRMR